jgi:phage antirepressor YoqD-like protein
VNIDAQISIFIRDDEVKLEFRDDTASRNFLVVTMTHKNFVTALGNRGQVACKTAEVHNLTKLGKRMEHRQFEFRLKKDYAYKVQAKMATKDAERALKREGLEEWEPDTSFNSQGSFFTKKGQPWARTIIRRWVEDEDE